MKKNNMMYIPAICVTLCAAFVTMSAAAALKETSMPEDGLPVIGTYAKFVELAGEPVRMTTFLERFTLSDGSSMTKSSIAGANNFGGQVFNETQAMPTAAAAAPQAQAASDMAAEFSTTNTQVQGVDEADVVKTDGEYIYYCVGGWNGSSIKIIKTSPDGHMELAGSVDYAGKPFTPYEMYVDGDVMVVIGVSYDGRYLSQRNFSITTMYEYDISDKNNIKEIRVIESDGNYVSSRKIGDSVYVVSSISAYSLMRNNNYILPCYADSSIQNKSIEIGYDRIYYYPEIVSKDFTIITGFKTGGSKTPANVYTYFGGGENLYVSEKNMYVAVTGYNNASVSGNETKVYKFRISDSNIYYVSEGKAPGRILNQFSMDEYNGYFRIATTSNDKNYQTTNNMYIMDSGMSIVGRVENIAPREKIYSVRFMGDRAYMVTFEKVDPLFVIDLKDPAAPKILGALKIPGYSDYLHLYDENHLIGFGKDTVLQYDTAYYQGMKLSMFDVTDLENPVEMFTEIIGSRGTDSPLLTNHKALLFSKEKNILAFPVSVYEIEGRQTSATQYGVFAYQGAYVYNIDMDKGFTLQGKISHMSNEEYKKAGYYGGYDERYIQRIIYSGSNFYTLSNSMVKANDMRDLKEKCVLSIE